MIATQYQAPLPRSKLRALNETHTQVTVTLDQETMALLERFKNLTAHENPQGDLAKAVKLALTKTLEKIDPTREVRRKSNPLPTSNAAGRRGISKSLKRQVWIKSKGRCEFHSPEIEKRCESQYALQVDHMCAKKRERSLRNERSSTLN